MSLIQLKLIRLLCLLSLCFLGSCRMTQEQIRSVSPSDLTAQTLPANVNAAEPETDQTSKRLPISLVFAGLALLVGAYVYLKSDQKPPVEFPDLLRKKVKNTSRRPKSRKKS